MALDLIAELQALIGAFDRDGVDYALCGGLAVAIHGHPRATMDIDVLVRPERLPAAMQVARNTGFDVPGRKTSALVSVDMIVVGPSLEDVWAGRLVAPWQGRDVSIVSRVGLIQMKRLAGRPQILADIAALEGANDDEQG